MPDWLAVVLLGILEGLTEFIPVSSTGHLLLAERWLPRQSDLFNIVIQCGAVLAVLPLFPERLRQCSGFWRDAAARDYVLKIAVAFALTAAPGLALDRLGFKLPEAVFPVALALVLGGVGFLAVEAWLRGRTLRHEISWGVVIAVAVGQLIAGVFPGTSRSGATILLALLLGVARPAATEFSFLVGIPTMLSAGGWKIFKALRHAGDAPPEHWGLLLLGTAVAAGVSFVAVRWLLRYVQTHTFVVFGWYRIVLGLALLLAVR
jgi:undecaprenyl-diphosphatase